MDKAQIPSLDELLEMALIEGVELIVCRMTLDLMEIDESELIEGSIGQIRGSPPREREDQGQNIRQRL
jgi:peroxiredoxin family protein